MQKAQNQKALRFEAKIKMLTKIYFIGVDGIFIYK